MVFLFHCPDSIIVHADRNKPTQKKPENTIGIALANRGENIFRIGNGFATGNTAFAEVGGGFAEGGEGVFAVGESFAGGGGAVAEGGEGVAEACWDCSPYFFSLMQ